MFARLPNMRAKDLIRTLEHAGFFQVRQKGSHVTLHHASRDCTVVVPLHTGELPRPLFKTIIKDAGYSEDEFRALI